MARDRYANNPAKAPADKSLAAAPSKKRDKKAEGKAWERMPKRRKAKAVKHKKRTEAFPSVPAQGQAAAGVRG